MQKTIQISYTEEEFQSIIVDCVNACLKHNKQSNLSQPEADQLLTIQQAGELLNLSVPTLYGYVQRAEIPVCKRGGRLYFSRLELIDWIKAGRKKTLAETAAEAEEYIKSKGVKL